MLGSHLTFSGRAVQVPLLEEKLACRTTAEWLDVLEDAGMYAHTT